jgi:predicted nucleic acid-binding protein
LNVVDSSAWLEFFNGGPNRSEFRAAILNIGDLLVPTVVLLEVERRLLQAGLPDGSGDILTGMRLGRVVALDEALASEAAVLGVRHRLPLADSIIYATARAHDAVVWTQDRDFEGLPGVEYRAKQ